ncbi:hypothetical protein HZA56_18925 [Candidatus Poribacteria bacterium]|nr:hypothetical protein [Candidatus Poribacteria bacterium]
MRRVDEVDDMDFMDSMDAVTLTEGERRKGAAQGAGFLVSRFWFLVKRERRNRISGRVDFMDGMDAVDSYGRSGLLWKAKGEGGHMLKFRARTLELRNTCLDQ